MKKFLLTTALGFLLVGSVSADPLDEFRGNGQIDYFDLDFAMQNELDNAVNFSEMRKEQRAGAATAGALAMAPKLDGAVGMGVVSHEGEEALALGYSKAWGANKEHFGTAGMSVGSQNSQMFGLGYAYKF